MGSMLATLLTVLVLAIVHLVAGTTAALQSLIDRTGLFPGLDRHIYSRTKQGPLPSGSASFPSWC